MDSFGNFMQKGTEDYFISFLQVSFNRQLHISAESSSMLFWFFLSLTYSYSVAEAISYSLTD